MNQAQNVWNEHMFVRKKNISASLCHIRGPNADNLDQPLAREQGRPLPRQLLQHVPAYDTAEPARQRT